MKEWLKKLVEDERRNAPSCASLYGPEFHTQLNEEGIQETTHKDGISRLRAELAQRDSKIAELERGSEDNSDSWRYEAVSLDAEAMNLESEVSRLSGELALAVSALKKISGWGRLSDVHDEYREYWASKADPHSPSTIARKALECLRVLPDPSSPEVRGWAK